ncbi:MAG: hypothetical protein V1754_07225, partial [Pseudomonadota bacterium]
KDYQRSTVTGNFSSITEEQDVVSVQKTITEVSLPGIVIQDHWINPSTGSLYALAELELKNMSQALSQAQNLNVRIRNHVRENAQKAFEDLDRELKKRNASQPVSEQSEPEPPPPPTPTQSTTAQ